MGDAEMGLLRVAFSRCLAAFFSWGLRFRAAEMKTQGGAGDDGLKLGPRLDERIGEKNTVSEFL
jgi:hypothetical protein